MSSVAKNISSNLLATLFITLLTLAVTPAQIHILGVEAYGLIGFVATLQVFFIVFELGLSTTIIRFVAEHSSGREVDELMSAARSLYWISAFAIGIALIFSSNSIAENWFKGGALGSINLERSLIAISCYLAVRWPISFYSGVLIGLQKINISNALKIIATTIRLLGGLLLIFIYPRLEVFLWWMVFAGATETLSYVIYFKKVLIGTNWTHKISFRALKNVWKFSASVGVISIFGLVISQLDRIIGSKFLSLEEFGYYSIAYGCASTILLLISSLSSAMLPYFSLNQGNRQILLKQYKYANEIMIFIVGFAVFPFIFYGDFILTIWVGSQAATFSYIPLAFLAAGFCCSAALANAYNMTIALGKPEMTLKLSVLSALPYGVILYYLIVEYGLNGAAFGWLALNFFYLIFLTSIVNKSLMKISTHWWSIKNMGPFLILGCVVFSFSKFFVFHFFYINEIIVAILMLASVFLYAFFGYWLLDPEIRLRLTTLLKRSG